MSPSSHLAVVRRAEWSENAERRGKMPYLSYQIPATFLVLPFVRRGPCYYLSDYIETQYIHESSISNSDLSLRKSNYLLYDHRPARSKGKRGSEVGASSPLFVTLYSLDTIDALGNTAFFQPTRLKSALSDLPIFERNQ